MVQSVKKSVAIASGASAIEYVFIASLIAIATLGSLTAGRGSSEHAQLGFQQSEMASSRAVRI